ncbi:MAG: tetratricopeptide repeat protein, partial [bacterium]|nr:tetratricopeptide repeat protein [Candidatus Colisoma equi]
GCGPGDGAKEFSEGKEAYILRDLKTAERLFTESLAVAPQDVDRILFLARTELELGELEKAKELVDRAAGNSSGEADVILLQSQVAWHMKDYKTAADGFSAIARDAKLDAAVRSQGWAGLGVVEMTCDNHHLARIAFLRALRLDRKSAAAWYHLGLLYRDGFGYLEAALEQFEIFVRLEERASPRVQKVQRTVIPALKEQIARAAAERPGVDKRNSAACAAAITAAEAAVKKDNLKAARESYQKALAADPLSYPAALGLAKAWERTGAKKDDLQKAFENYKIACALRPSAVTTFLSTGSLATKLGFSLQAVEIYSRAVAANPNSPEAIDGLIRALRKTGGKEKVAAAYQEYRLLLARK